jgi:hypothetical protein
MVFFFKTIGEAFCSRLMHLVLSLIKVNASILALINTVNLQIYPRANEQAENAGNIDDPHDPRDRRIPGFLVETKL